VTWRSLRYRIGALRFAITRIADFALRPVGVRGTKDWRRFWDRLTALEGLERGRLARIPVMRPLP
jgi:hypothetical protein